MSNQTIQFSPFLPGKLTWQSLLLGVSLISFGPAYAIDPGPYVPNYSITKQMSESDVFSEAMTLGSSEGILVGETGKLMQERLQVSTPIRIKVVKGGVDGNDCQIMYTSMAVTGIQAPKMGVNLGDYIFTNKLTLCKNNSQPLVDVTHCVFGGRSCMPTEGSLIK